MWGAANSNYAGTMGHDLNPASIVGNHFKWELHIVSADIFAMNNYLYLRKGSHAIRNGIKGQSLAADRITYKNNKRDKSAYASVFAKLPAFMYSTQKWGLGFHVSSRVLVSARGVPYHLANFMKEGFDFTDQQKIEYNGGNAKIAAMNWHEAGITGGFAIKDNGSDYATAGITLNYLYGLNSIYLNVDNINYNVQADTLWQIYIANIEYGHSSADVGSTGNLFQKKGSGVSGSLGFQYYKNRNPDAYNPCIKGKPLKKYDYKIGFSLIDIGRIKFKTNASKFVFNDVSTDWYGIDTVKVKGLSGTDATFNKQFFGSSDAGKAASAYSIWLPAAASLQFDYSITPSFYLNVSLMQRIPLNHYTMRRSNQISITARYERKYFEIDIPYSYYDYFRHRIGIALRLGILTIGTDMIGPYTGLADAYGVDFYLGLKWQHFAKCNKRKNKSKGHKSGFDDCFHEI